MMTPSLQKPPSLRRFLAKEKLPRPPLPGTLEGQLQSQGDWTWSTLPQEDTLYDVEPWIDRLEDDRDTDFLAVGHEGHGTASWFLHYYLNYQGLAVFLQIPWGGMGTDQKSAVAGIRRRFEIVQSLLDQCARRDSTDTRGTLVVEDAVTGKLRWGWLAGSSESVDWVIPSWHPLMEALDELKKRP